MTEAGRQASAWTESWFGADATGQPTAEVSLDLVFDIADPVSLALVRHRDNDGHLLAYLWRESAHVNLAAVAAGGARIPSRTAVPGRTMARFSRPKPAPRPKASASGTLASTAPAAHGVTVI